MYNNMEYKTNKVELSKASRGKNVQNEEEGMKKCAS